MENFVDTGHVPRLHQNTIVGCEVTGLELDGQSWSADFALRLKLGGDHTFVHAFSSEIHGLGYLLAEIDIPYGRDAMADAGTKLVRRWLIWSAVTMATMCDREVSAGWKWRWRPPVFLTLGAVAVLGFWAFVDLIDVAIGIPNLCWMGDRPWYYELIGALWGRS